MYHKLKHKYYTLKIHFFLYIINITKYSKI